MKFDFTAIKHLLESRERYIVEDSSLIEAGVLLPIFFKEEIPHILFTKRTHKVEHHKGEISFPGGMKSDDDEDILQTVMRETEEEIGVAEKDIDILGALDDMPTITEFKITPFAGIISSPAELKINKEEIERIIEVPLPLLMSENKWSETYRDYKGNMLKTYVFNFNGDIIWGATAGILKHFIEISRDVWTKKNIKNEKLIGKICKRFCSFYKEGKEEMLCRGAGIFRIFFDNSQNERFLAYFNEEISCPKVFYQNDEMLKKICRKCDFYITGCDFTDPDFKGYSPPCGGYIAIVCLIKGKNIALSELLDAEDECGG